MSLMEKYLKPFCWIQTLVILEIITSIMQKNFLLLKITLILLFPVPRGREEEWRFKPMKRFAPLFDLDAIRTATLEGGAIELVADVPEGVTVETVTRDDARIGSIGAPVDRTGITA